MKYPKGAWQEDGEPIRSWTPPSDNSKRERLARCRALAEQIFLRAFDVTGVMRAAMNHDAESYERQAEHAAIVSRAAIEVALAFDAAFDYHTRDVDPSGSNQTARAGQRALGDDHG